MTHEEKLALLAHTLEAEPGELKPEIVLETLDYWDSLAKLSVMAMFTTTFDRAVEVATIRSFKTVDDILQEMHG